MDVVNVLMRAEENGKCLAKTAVGRTEIIGEQRTMKYNELPEQCKTCQNLKVWALDMGGNHLVSCKKGSWNFYQECDCYEQEEENEYR